MVVFLALSAPAMTQSPPASPASPPPQASVPSLASSAAPANSSTPAGETSGGAVKLEPKQAKVKVGVYINDIQAINLHDNTFSADLYIWFRNADAELTPGDTFEFMNLANPTDHQQTAFNKEPAPQPDGSKYQLFRHQGLFVSKFSVRTYPFDQQSLRLEVEDQQSTADRMTYVVDEISMNPALTIPGYVLGKPTMTIYNKAYPTAFGDLSNPQALPYSRLIVSIPVTRPVLSGVIKTFLPIVIILMVAGAALVLDPSHIDARIGLAITALLTLVALQFTATQNLPEVSYLLMLDQIYLASYTFILMVVVMVVRTTRQDDVDLSRGDSASIAKIVRSGPVLAFFSALIYLLAIGLILIFNLS